MNPLDRKTMPCLQLLCWHLCPSPKIKQTQFSKSIVCPGHSKGYSEQCPWIGGYRRSCIQSLPYAVGGIKQRWCCNWQNPQRCISRRESRVKLIYRPNAIVQINCVCFLINYVNHLTNSGIPSRLDIFVCGDQIRKGAALNAIQIAELLL